jgi:hypothetical protein
MAAAICAAAIELARAPPGPTYMGLDALLLLLRRQPGGRVRGVGAAGVVAVGRTAAAAAEPSSSEESEEESEFRSMAFCW